MGALTTYMKEAVEIVLKCLTAFEQGAKGTRVQWQMLVFSFILHSLCPETCLYWFFLPFKWKQWVSTF